MGFPKKAGNGYSFQFSRGKKKVQFIVSNMKDWDSPKPWADLELLELVHSNYSDPGKDLSQ